MKLAAFIQAVPARAKFAEQIASDARYFGCDSATVLYQAEGTTPWQHFFDTFDAMLRCDAQLVLRLEDDVRLSPYLGHNCKTWPVVQLPRFGCGLLYSPPTSIVDYMYASRPDIPYPKRWLAGGCAQLFRRCDLDTHLVGLRSLYATPEFSVGYGFDTIVSAYCFERGWELYTHNPPIVEHLEDLESAIGNPRFGERNTGGAFDPEFRR